MMAWLLFATKARHNDNPLNGQAPAERAVAPVRRPLQHRRERDRVGHHARRRHLDRQHAQGAGEVPAAHVRVREVRKRVHVRAEALPDGFGEGAAGEAELLPLRELPVAS